MIRVDFLYSIDQQVKTMFGDVGVVKSLLLDDGGKKKAWVQRSTESAWFDESDIKPVD